MKSFIVKNSGKLAAMCAAVLFAITTVSTNATAKDVSVAGLAVQAENPTLTPNRVYTPTAITPLAAAVVAANSAALAEGAILVSAIVYTAVTQH